MVNEFPSQCSPVPKGQKVFKFLDQVMDVNAVIREKLIVGSRPMSYQAPDITTSN